MSDAQRQRNRVAALSKTRRAGDPDLTQAQADLAAVNLDSYIRTQVARAPRLTSDQRQALASLLRGDVR